MKRSVRKVYWILLILIAIVSYWHFIFKDEHYKISFDYDEPSSIVLKNLDAWHNTDQAGLNILESDEIAAEGQFTRLIKAEDSTFLFRWKVIDRPSGGSRVEVKVNDQDHFFAQKIQAPFIKNDFVLRSIKTVTDVRDAFKTKAKSYKVHSIKDSIRTSEFCAYIGVESTTSKKANAMLYNIGFVMDYLNEHNIEINGDPFLEITQWDKKTDSIRFDFCFPIQKRDSFPPTDIVKFKESLAFNGLKAEFNGNYRDSDRAWYYLLDKAKQDQKEISGLPVEIFLNDPHEGGDPINWKALIYLPLKD